MVNVDAVFVAHVKKGSEKRAEAMERQLSRLGIRFEYMLDGDISDLSEERLERYFVKDVDLNPAARSCAMKHLLIMEEVVKRKLNRVLVLEDDAILRSDFVELFNRSLDEVDTIHSQDEPYLIFYEASYLKFIPRSVRKKGKTLYNPKHLQCLACYVINNSYAHSTLN